MSEKMEKVPLQVKLAIATLIIVVSCFYFFGEIKAKNDEAYVKEVVTFYGDFIAKGFEGKFSQHDIEALESMIPPEKNDGSLQKMSMFFLLYNREMKEKNLLIKANYEIDEIDVDIKGSKGFARGHLVYLIDIYDKRTAKHIKTANHSAVIMLEKIEDKWYIYDIVG